MAIEKETRVQGTKEDVWGKILTVLSMNGYTIKSQVQNVQLTAEKGSRLVSSMVGGTKGGYRTAEIAMSPSDGGKMLVKFKFVFSALGAGTAWGGAKDEIDKMIGEFEHECSKDTDKQTTQIPKSESSNHCPKCHKLVSFEFALCPFCGQALKSDSCKKCGKELKPEFAMCPFCGTPK